jgi:hypothetical protein
MTLSVFLSCFGFVIKAFFSLFLYEFYQSLQSELGLPVVVLAHVYNQSKMADLLTVLSAFIVVFAFLFLGMFISRLGVAEARGFVGPVIRSAMDIPSKSLAEVRNPFIVKLVEDRPLQKGRGVTTGLFSATATPATPPHRQGKLSITSSLFLVMFHLVEI